MTTDYIELIFLHHIHPHLSRHSLILLASLVNQGCTAADKSFRNHLSSFLDNYTSFLLGDSLVAFLITTRKILRINTASHLNITLSSNPTSELDHSSTSAIIIPVVVHYQGNGLSASSSASPAPHDIPLSIFPAYFCRFNQPGAGRISV